MSLCLGLVTLGDANITRVLEDPPLIWCVIAPDDPDMQRQARPKTRKPGLMARLFGKKASLETPLPDLELGDTDGVTIDLDKAWHGIHYLLTMAASGREVALDFLLSGGRQVGEIDVGYGPARAFSAGETRSLHEALSKIGDGELRSQFNPGDMMAQEIYPETWDRNPKEDDTLGYLMDNVQKLREFVRDAAERRTGMILYMT